MRDLSIALRNHLASTTGLVVRQLLWIAARDRLTGQPDPIGLWSGEDHRNFVIDGESRTYYATGQFINFGKLTTESNLNVHRLVSTVTPLSDEVQSIIHLYNVKMAPVQLHLVVFNPETNNPVDVPIQALEGWIDRFPIKRGKPGQDATGTLEIVGHTRILTLAVHMKRSNDSQMQRSVSDAFFRDVALTGQVQTAWGSKGVNGVHNGTSGMLKHLITR